MPDGLGKNESSFCLNRLLEWRLARFALFFCVIILCDFIPNPPGLPDLALVEL